MQCIISIFEVQFDPGLLTDLLFGLINLFLDLFIDFLNIWLFKFVLIFLKFF